MYPRLLHIYGPLWIHSYGFMIALGFLIFLCLTKHHILKLKIVNEHQFFNIIFIGLISGIIGGRFFFIISEWNNIKDNLIQFFYPWIGGFGVLGSIIAVLISVSIYAKAHKIKILPILDIASIYAPLLQTISRFGCFLAGCCYGVPASKNFIFAVKFTNIHGLAPLNVWLHPAQLYSSFASLLIFFTMYFVSKKVSNKKGMLIFLYLTLESLSRFITDFWRGDRDFINIQLCKFNLSSSQLTAAFLFVFAFLSLIYVLKKK